MTVQTALSQVADAIRDQTGESSPMRLAEMPGKIGGIPQTISCKEVNFWDCDGTCLSSYTQEEAMALTELPPLPNRTGFICQGWNWTLEEIQDLGRPVQVGAIYTTDSGRTRLTLRVDSELRREVPLYWGQTLSHGVTIYWGDGSPGETHEGTGNLTVAHRYEELGDYVVELAVAEDCALSLGHGTVSTAFVGGNMLGYRSMLHKVHVGAGVSAVEPYAFASCYHLEEITMPQSVTSIGSNAFSTCNFLSYAGLPSGIQELEASVWMRCYDLRQISLPPGITGVGNNAFYFCYSLERVTLPDDVTKLGNSAFYSCVSLQELVVPRNTTSVGTGAFYSCLSLRQLVLPNGVTSFGSNLFYTCYSLTSLTIPESVATIAGNSCNGCYGLSQLTIPAGVTGIAASAFAGCAFIKEYHLKPQTPPAMASSSALTGISDDCIIYVPAGCLERYQSAANWSAYAGHMREEPAL